MSSADSSRSTNSSASAAFRDMHLPGRPLLMPNAWDAGSARLLESLGARAVATTSSGFAATFGRHDGQMSRDEVLAHCGVLVQAVSIPVSADLEDGYGSESGDVVRTFEGAAAAGLAGASIEDWSDDQLLCLEHAAARVTAAREAAPGLVLTARVEGYLHGNTDVHDAVARLQAYAEAGADVVFAPGIPLPDLITVVAEVPRPVNALILPGSSVEELTAAGVARISVGGGLAATAWNGAANAARDFLAGGSGWLAESLEGRQQVSAALQPPDGAGS